MYRFKSLKSAMEEYKAQATRKAIVESSAQSVYFGTESSSSSSSAVNQKLISHVKELEKVVVELTNMNKQKDADIKVRTYIYMRSRRAV